VNLRELAFFPQKVGSFWDSLKWVSDKAGGSRPARLASLKAVLSTDFAKVQDFTSNRKVTVTRVATNWGSSTATDTGWS
jgi:hypothetical protein